MASEPPKSLTKDNTSHHTSPTGDKPQKPLIPVPKQNVRQVTGTIRTHKMPEPVYKHTNPVGRPKNPRG
jgi:hypothetical protein